MKNGPVLQLIFLLLSLTRVAFGMEGMFVPVKERLPAMEMNKLGIAPAMVESLTNGAVVRINNGGCTATLLSPQGLIGTNWHCVTTCVNLIQSEAQQHKGDPLATMMKDGYVATSPEKELTCKATTVDVPIGIENVSARFDEFEKVVLEPKERSELIRRRKELVREECMKGKTDVVCDVSFMNNDPKPYYLHRFKRLRDIRLVWVPSHIIGEFGGLTDNWEYPRHTGDFAFIRAYENGKPFAPAAFAKVSSAGVKPNDPTFILGFPGMTERNITSSAAKFLQMYHYPYAHEVYLELAKTIEAVSPNPMAGPYGASWFYLENYIENFERKAKLMGDLNVVAKKKDAESKLKNKGALGSIEQIYADLPHYFRNLYFLEFLVNRRTPLKSLLAAADIWRISIQPRDDKERQEERFKSWNRDALESQIRTVDNVGTNNGERALLAKAFQMANTFEMPIRAFTPLRMKAQLAMSQCAATKSCDQMKTKSLFRVMADLVYDQTNLVAKNDSVGEKKRAEAKRMDLLKWNPHALVDTKDSLLLLAKNIVEELDYMKSNWEYGAPYTYELDRLNYSNNLAMGFETPDANSTLRFTMSTVQKEYLPIAGGGPYPFITTLASMVLKDGFIKDPKNDDYELFQVPQAIKDASKNMKNFESSFYYDKNMSNVPVDFITAHVITGGNSGSSVFNAKGEVVGFAFDGTPESIVTDLWYHPHARTISVDMRFIGFLGNVIVPTAKRVIEELGLPVDSPSGNRS